MAVCDLDADDFGRGGGLVLDNEDGFVWMGTAVRAEPGFEGVGGKWLPPAEWDFIHVETEVAGGLGHPASGRVLRVGAAVTGTA